MKYSFHICDVFTRQRFGGNPLAVLTSADGLNGLQMQQIAREFNFSETTFVFSPGASGHRRVRIFTPAREVPFAGHPNIGTAFVLAHRGELGSVGTGLTVVFDELAGEVSVDVSRNAEGAIRCELTAPQELSLGPVLMPEIAAAALSLNVADISLNVHPPRVAGVGLPFLLVELVGLDVLGRASFNKTVMETLHKQGISPDILLYTRTGRRGEAAQPVEIRARMFAPIDGVPEDPATGSANCALAALLSHCDPAQNASFTWSITQGVEMGRPSFLEARTRKIRGVVTETKIGGDCVMVAEGMIEAG